MTLTYKEAQLVKSTIPFLREHGDQISEISYATLVNENPELNNTLNLVHLKDGRLSRALTVIVLRFASNINNISELIPKLERICNKHVTLNIQPEHYALLGTIIIETFGAVMGAGFTPEIRTAWTKAYKVLSGLMIGREQHMYREHAAGKWGPTYCKFRVDRKVLEANDLYSFYLVPTDGRRLPSFLPGQYVTLRVFVPEINYFQTRQYSLSDAARAGGDYYRVTVKRDRGLITYKDVALSYTNPGVVSNQLIDRVRPGDEIECSHPSGEFYLDTSVPSSVPVVLISAGVGVSPLMAMLNAVAEAQPRRVVSWIHGCRDEVPFDTRITIVRRRCPNVGRTVFKTALARGDAQGVTYDYHGRVDLGKLGDDVLHTDHGGSEYYICGPESFMKAMVGQLVARGVRMERIKCEVFSVGEMKLDTVCA